MADVVSKGTLFDPVLVNDVFDKVKGKSSLSVLSGQVPLSFNGREQFTFSMDDEVDIVAENGKKGRGSITIEPVTMVPVKVEYGARLSDEFLYASDEAKIDILKSFNEGFAKKLARGLDLMALHGVNPRSGESSVIIGTNSFDSKVTQKVTTGDTADTKVEAAVALVQGSDQDVTGMAMAPAFRTALAALVTGTGEKLYPELAWGAAPGEINGLPVSVNSTVSGPGSTDLAVIGDFANAFQWGFAKEIPMEVIQYGDPDNSGMDLKGYNQVYIRCEAYIGWGILVPEAFALVQ